jgi:hypothetical protein
MCSAGASKYAGSELAFLHDRDYCERPHRFLHLQSLVDFGLGKHMCLGQYIARAQLQVGIRLIARRMRNPRKAGEPGWRPFPGNWGIDGLPVEFEPANATCFAANASRHLLLQVLMPSRL